jgi:hypothetical protein
LNGSRVTGRVRILETEGPCLDASVEPAPSITWGVGIIGGSVTPVAVDSIRGMSRQDSTGLARTAFRLASSVPNEPTGRFAGLAFRLVDLWRIPRPGGGWTMVAALKRLINQEDSPLEERTFLVAEADSVASSDYSLRYSDRSSGLEETVESRELLAAVAQPASMDLILAHDFGHQTAYSILERSALGKWTTRWTSRRFTC